MVLMLLAGAGLAVAEPGLAPAEARIREQGLLQPNGDFSFWTNGVLGDWFLAEGDGPVEIRVVAQGRAWAGEPPRLGVELVPPAGEPRQVARIEVDRSGFQEYTVRVPGARGFFGVQLRHLNRVTEGTKELRHLLLRSFRVEGARPADCGPAEWLLFRSGGAPTPGRPGPARLVETRRLRVEMDPASGTWSVAERGGGQRVEGIHPRFFLQDLPVDLRDYRVEYATRRRPDHPLGPRTGIELRYTRAQALDITYRLLVGEETPDVVAQVDFANRAGRPLVVQRVAPLVIPRASLGGPAARWMALGDGKRNNDPGTLLPVAEARGFECWWYVAAKHRDTGRSLLLGNLTNHKGLGRFFLSADGGAAMRLGAMSDYESVVMPDGARIEGELTLLHFGRKGTDSLERFGDLVARAHGIDLLRQHPIDPYDPDRAGLFETWNSYGAGVVRGFGYRHDRAKYEAAYMDPAWTRANWQKVAELGLRAFGYGGPGKTAGAPSPLARRYGQPDFWFKEAQAIAKEHPEYYVDGCADFSNPGVLAFERARVAPAFRDATKIVRYSWDFTNEWRKLSGQHDPFQTSAETYRAAMGVWREHARRHPAGAYAFIWMNVVGLNYDRCDVIHIGHDSDQGYGGPGLTFTHGLTRQISGRYWYNGRVWWNSPDSFHVYAGGIYSHNQAKVHASFCALSGNLVHLAEPFTDQETPEDRLEIIRRVSPTTPDVSQAVDVFEHSPARLWNLPVRRTFGAWNVVGLFNVDYDGSGTPITQRVDFAALGLAPDREYLVYEFWSRQFLGALKGGFTRTLAAPDGEVYAIVEKREHPVLLSTSRHVRQMAYDLRALKWDPAARTLSGTSRVVAGDPYELRVFVPEGYTLERASAGDLQVETKAAGPLALARSTATKDGDVAWSLVFRRRR